MTAVFTDNNSSASRDGVPASAENAEEGPGQLLDLRALRKLADDTAAELVPRMVGIFIDELREQAATIAVAAQATDMESLQRESHVMKGSAALFGASRVRASAEQLNAACKAGNATLALSLIDALLADIPPSIRALQANYGLADPDAHDDSPHLENGQ